MQKEAEAQIRLDELTFATVCLNLREFFTENCAKFRKNCTDFPAKNCAKMARPKVANVKL